MVKRRFGKKLTASVMIMAVLMALLAMPAMAAPNDTTVYITVERLTLNGGVIQQPMKVTLDSDDDPTILDALYEAGIDMNVSNPWGTNYIEGVADAGNTGSLINPSTGAGYDFLTEITAAETANGLSSGSTWSGDGETVDGYLSELDYNNYAGLMVSLNDDFNIWDGVDTAVSDGDVVRMQFTLFAGCDLGETGWIQDSSSNWVSVNPFITTADKTDLIKALVDNPTDPDWNSAYAVFLDLEATQAAVDTAEASL